MHFVMFYHSLVSDWNHGNAHFLRGVARELLRRGHDVTIYEPRGSWSLSNLVQEAGERPIEEFSAAYPELKSCFYDPNDADVGRMLATADVVLVHEWSEPRLVAAVGRHHARHPSYRLLFHDTHHRCVTAVDQMRAYELDHYDGVLAFGEVIRQVYLNRGWAGRAWTWHEAADVSLFYPRGGDDAAAEPEGDLVWVGNWGDEERSEEIRRYLIEPSHELGLKTVVHGVRYPHEALRQLEDAKIRYGGWIPNYRVPELFARFRCTAHIPRRPYREQLIGVPTIRVFEALACGIPLISMRWDDAEGLFRPGTDYLLVDSPEQMRDALRAVLSDKKFARELTIRGRESILQRHTCGHRVDELLGVVAELAGDKAKSSPRRQPRVVAGRKGAVQ